MKLVIHTDGSTEGANPSRRGVAAFVVHKADDPTVRLGSGTAERVCSLTRAEKTGKITSNEMEFLAVAQALKHLDYYRDTYPNYQNYTHVEIRSDSTLVVQILNREWVCKAANLKPMVKEIWELCDKLPQEIEFRWIPRHLNEECDKLSKSLY